MNIALSDDQVKQILKRAEKQVEQEAVEMLRSIVTQNMSQWASEMKNMVKTALVGQVSDQVMRRLDVNGCVGKAMESVNKRIHTEINRRIQNGITVSFQAVLAKTNDTDSN